MSISLPGGVARPQEAPAAGVKEALAPFRATFIGLFLMSCVVNLLYLTGSFFMLEVYDRVLPSRSVPTLIALGLLVAFLFVAQAGLDVIRSRILVRVAAAFDLKVSKRVFDSSLRLALSQNRNVNAAQPGQDLDQIKSFLTSGGPIAFFDLPWMPIYLAICFMFHSWVGWSAVGGAIILITMTHLTEVGTKTRIREANLAGMNRNALAEASRHNVEVVHALGMGNRLAAMWAEWNVKMMAASNRASDVSLGLGATSRTIRLALQSFTLALCAYLVIEGQATGGVMIASSIIVARALAPVELAIGQWKNFVGARQSWRRLSDMLDRLRDAPKMPLPAPHKTFATENVALAAPGQDRLLVGNITFQLQAGDGLGIIGRSGCGKSSLARGLVGIWPPVRGAVRIDGASLDQWTPETLGPHIGYLPQNVELFAGTVGQNISRFDPDATPAAVIAAARAAGVHDLVMRLPEGYETQIGVGGAGVSGGQRQRIALARALYGEPFLVVLDEPNSNLDGEGDEALSQAITGVRARGGIAVVIAHRPSALASVNLVLIMNAGTVQAFGEKDTVLQTAMVQPAVTRAPKPGEAAITAAMDEEAKAS